MNPSEVQCYFAEVLTAASSYSFKWLEQGARLEENRGIASHREKDHFGIAGRDVRSARRCLVILGRGHMTI